MNMTDHTPTDARPEALDGPLSRRAALAAGGVATASAALLAAGCSTYTPSGSNSTAAPSEAPAGSAAPAADGAPNAAAGAAPAQASGIALGPASSVPVGGGRVFANQKVVVTQPTAGQFKAFSAVCTHKGCTVNKVSDGTIDCPCHDSKFSISDGSVQDGPAKKPLPAKNVSSAGGTLRLT
jgi:Rieske Fe-S protein